MEQTFLSSIKLAIQYIFRDEKEYIKESQNMVSNKIQELPKRDYYENEQDNLLLQSLLEKIDQLTELFNEKISQSTSDEKVIDRLHSELQTYKKDLYLQMLRPVLLDLIRIKVSINKKMKEYDEERVSQKIISREEFELYDFDINEILEKNSVESYNSNPGDVFIPRQQTIIDKVDTNKKELHSRIVRSVEYGYTLNGKVLLPEKVIVYAYVNRIERN